ncbi:MAG: NTP transferase domain-containing protein [Chthonomonas sp.]|nr:NTP transferase domain-containing protein [Chthonomonas sp.]
MKAVVMAGGEGSRLRPITANRPKPLVPVANEPIMQHIVRLLSRHGVKEVVSTLHYLADEIQGYFDDGSDFGVKMHYSIEDTPLGTAGSVKKAEALLQGETFFIVSGDALTDCDLSKALAFHREKKSLATLVLYRVTSPLEFGVVITDDDGRVVRFLEKPSWSEVFSDTVNTGIYILEPEILEMMKPGKQYDWSQDIFPELLREGKPLYGYVMDDYWCDVGTLEQYREAQEHLLSGRIHLPILGEQIEPGIWVGPNTNIDERAVLMPPIVIGRNTKIKGDAKIGPYTVIGDNALLEEGAHVERSVVWDGSYIGPNVTVQSAIIGARCTIKRDCQIGEDAVVGDRCLIDTGCTIRPRIKLWPDKVIERGSTVTMSLVWGNKWRGNLFRELGVAGLSNVEITPEFATRLGSAFGSILPNKATIVTSRDSSRSSRMIKRAIMASLLSVGCEVLDMQSSAVPVARHFIRTSGASGAVNVRKMPGNSRVTLIELFDARGNYLSKSHERKVETAFFREDFHRCDPDDLGAIEYASRAIEDYTNDFFHQLGPIQQGRRLRVVCDFGYSAISSFFAAMAGRLEIDTININSFSDSKRAPRSPSEIARHMENLQQIVGTLGYDFGVLFTNEGERLTVVDSTGAILSGTQLLAAMSILKARTNKNPTLALNVTASSVLEDLLVSNGACVVRTKADSRALMAAAMNPETQFAGDSSGGFIFPSLHPGFDAMFALANLVLMLERAETTLRDVVAGLPAFHVKYQQVRCPWESKGTIMRVLTESQHPDQMELVDGVKLLQPGGWALVLPDSFEPVFHIFAEGETDEMSQEYLDRYVHQIEEMQQHPA